VITVLHAYSRSNSGDGLLVDLTMQLLQEALPHATLNVIALDAASFDDGRVRQFRLFPGSETPRGEGRRATVQASVKASEGVVAVGGGYLRADGLMSAAKFTVAHLSQLLLASRSSVPAVYLPQSIGPLPVGLRGPTLAALSRLSSVHVRDDTSLRFVAGLSNVQRTPDLAVLEIAQAWSPRVQTGVHPEGPVVIVARFLPHGDSYRRRLLALRESLPEALWAVQSDGRGNTDSDFYRALDVLPAGRLTKVLSQHPRGVVISVRLHGALQALLAGWPSVHLAYERKGAGAYKDLGLSQWVHDARSFDPSVVRSQVVALSRDPGPMHSRVAESVESLKAQRQGLVEQLRAILDGP
jgi:polysaccharide pyruvyl transferase WcaK-like protein